MNVYRDDYVGAHDEVYHRSNKFAWNFSNEVLLFDFKKDPHTSQLWIRMSLTSAPNNF